MRSFTPLVIFLAGDCAVCVVEAKDNPLQIASFLHRMLLVDDGQKPDDGGSDASLTFDNPPCYPCGPNGFTTAPDQLLPFPGPNGEDISCSEALDLFVSGVASEQDCELTKEILFGSNLCSCASEPTVSPAPTASVEPSTTPTTSLLPTVSLCYLCGTQEAGTNISFDKAVIIPGFDEIPCFILNGILPIWLSSGDYFDEEFGEAMQCTDFQSFGKECGCLPLEPTISPAPTASVEPSLAPTSSPHPTAGPCFLCGGTEPFDFFDIGGDLFDFPDFGLVSCFDIQDIALYYVGLLPQGMECTDVQTFGKECGCPLLEPTISPEPTVSPEPSMSPTVSPAPTAPCSCEGLCDGHNYECNCWCDSICKSLDDCCGDVADYCVFSDNGEVILEGYIDGGEKTNSNNAEGENEEETVEDYDDEEGASAVYDTDTEAGNDDGEEIKKVGDDNE